MYDISVNASNLERVTFQGQGRSYTNGDSQPERNLRIQNGEVTLKWDVLRSDGGDIVSFKNSGFDIDGAAIASRAVVEDAESGAYALHVSAPITQFYGAFGQTGWPVIIVVEQATGERFAATSLLNATDNMGSLLFNPLQRSDDADTDNGRGDGSNVVFDIDLDNLGTETLYTGWQLLPFNRVSGYARSSGDTPTLPAIQGGDDANVVSGSDLPNDHPFNQFAFFEDNDDNGEWTADDDGELHGLADHRRELHQRHVVHDGRQRREHREQRLGVHRRLRRRLPQRLERPGRRVPVRRRGRRVHGVPERDDV